VHAEPRRVDDEIVVAPIAPRHFVAFFRKRPSRGIDAIDIVCGILGVLTERGDEPRHAPRLRPMQENADEIGATREHRTRVAAENHDIAHVRAVANRAFDLATHRFIEVARQRCRGG
jgi:hypothetical protein